MAAWKDTQIDVARSEKYDHTIKSRWTQHTRKGADYKIWHKSYQYTIEVWQISAVTNLTWISEYLSEPAAKPNPTIQVEALCQLKFGPQLILLPMAKHWTFEY